MGIYILVGGIVLFVSSLAFYDWLAGRQRERAKDRR